MEKTSLDLEFIKDIENQEAHYWSEYYTCCTNANNGASSVLLKIIEGTTCCAVPGSDTLAFNRCLGIGLDYPITQNQLNKIIDFYESAGIKRFMIQVSPAAQPVTYNEMLLQSGFYLHNNWVKWYKKIEGKVPFPETNYKTELLDLEEVDLFDKIIYEAFQFDGEPHLLMSQTYKRPGWHHYLAKDNGKPVAAASLFTWGRYASLAIAGTAPHARGKGAQSALIARRINDALDADCEYVIVETSEDKPDKPSASNRNMKRFGFETAYLRPNYVYQL